MAELQRNFLQGIMNKDLDPHFLPDGQYRDALNIIVGDSDATFSTTDGEHNGVVQNYLGNFQLNSDLGLLPDALCIGSISVPAQNIIYWFVTSSTFDAIFEYNEQYDQTSIVLKSIKAENNVLNFNRSFIITGVNYIDGLLFWTDNYNPPRKINIERCKNYAEDEFTEDDINVIVKPPIASPSIELSNDTATTANNLENKFLYFSYRYKYIDDEYSSLSPFSPVAFFPKPFAYDYGVSENISMVNSINTATISYNTGGANVTEVQLIFIDTLSTNAYVIDNINKQANNFADNVVETFDFKNNKVYTVLPADQVNRLFDNVPLKAKSQDLIGSRLVYGNYTQFFNLVDSTGANINPAFSLALEGAVITDNNPHATFKSNRDYELGIVYLDNYGRSTTVIVPTLNTNTLFIPADRANYANDIRVEIDKDFAPPAFATYYRFVLKQNKQEYYNVFPLTYFSDGQFKWFLINQPDVDKISIGSYLYLKNSTNTNLNTQFKVLDVVSQSANFLNNSKQQPAGVYFKVKINDNLLPVIYQYNSTNTATGPGQAIINRFKVAENPIFYGTGNNDLTTTNGNNIITTTFLSDVRFTIQIDSVSISGDKYKIFAFFDNNNTLISENNLIVAGSDITLSVNFNGTAYQICKVKFGSSSNHKVGDYWTVMCRVGVVNVFGGYNYNSDAPYGFATSYKWEPTSNFIGDRPIKSGAILTFKTKQPSNSSNPVNQYFISSNDYKNIEEWFFEDSIYSKFSQYNSQNINVGPKYVCFRRLVSIQGTVGGTWVGDCGSSISSDTLKSCMFMYIYGEDFGSLGDTMEVVFELIQPDSNILFETVPTDTNQDIYYELTNTYPIVNGSHTTNFTNQVLGFESGYAYLNRDNSFLYPNYDFNAFAWSNGVESFRIRDDFNAATMQFSPRANSTVEGYAQQTLVQALTYSGVYQQTTAINRLNEFNLSLGNFKYLDVFFGSIQKLYARDTDLVVFQENKITKVLYGKNLISDSIGGGTIASIPEVLGTQIAYVGEYGISENPESFAIWGNNLYFTDARRGAVLQLAENGLFEVSSNGMKNWFKANLDPSTQKLGMFDPYFEHYVVSINNERVVNPCQLSVSSNDVVVSNIANINQFAFAIESNSQWSIVVPTNNWLTVNTKFGNGNGQVLVNTTATDVARSVTVTVVGCNTDIDVIVRQSAAPPVFPTTWYSLRKCSDNTNHFSRGYQSPTIFFPNERVTSGSSTYVVLQGYSEDSGGTQLLITSTGQLFCPTIPPTQEWYTLINCTSGATATSQPYAINAFAINARVTSGGVTYRISAKTTTNPGGTQIAITSTGLTGCPPAPTEEWYRLYNCSTGAIANSIAYAIGTYPIGRRVTSAGNTYTISEILTTSPIEALLTLTNTGQSGCPTSFIYYTLT